MERVSRGVKKLVVIVGGLTGGEMFVQSSDVAVPAIQAASHRCWSNLLGGEVSEGEPAERWRQGVVAAVRSDPEAVGR